jgi:hypothetical protein
MTDAEFLNAFEQCALPEESWTHRAHVRMAWLYLGKGTRGEVLPIVREGIQRYNGTLNKTLAYHETITQAYLILIDDRMRHHQGCTSFEEFCVANPDLLDGLAALLVHYRRETLFSQAARQAFVEPDLAPWPSRSHAGRQSRANRDR